MNTYFRDFVNHVRSKGEVLLYQRVLEIDSDELSGTTSLLESAYTCEQLSYPFHPPGFCPEAAIWAAKLMYYSSQLLLYRQQSAEEMRKLIIPYNKEITSSAILSADLTLRFIPDILHELTMVDDTDPLIPMLEEILHTWHYSAVGYNLVEMKQLDFKIIHADECLNQLYVNRIIDKNALAWARHPGMYPFVEAALGLYKKELWPGFE